MNEIALYEIDKQIQELFESLIDLETGEIDEDLERELERLQMQKVDKAVNVALFIKNSEATADAIRNEEKRLSERRRTLQNRIEWLKQYLASSLNGESLERPNVKISWRKSEAVEVGPFADMEMLEKKGLAKIEYKPDKKAIKDFIKTTGLNFKDIQIIEKNNIQIK